MKQIIDLSRPSSVIRQSDFNVPNAVYKITQDFDLEDKVILIPEGCVLSFEGGSLNNGSIEGNDTLIKDNQFNAFFKSDLELLGDFSVMNIVANWFDEVEDCNMFQRAFDFAHTIFQAKKTYYSASSVSVSCLSKSYTMSKGVYIPVGVSFNGNKASLFPGKKWDSNDYMFKLNIQREEADWEVPYPGNIYDEFCFVNFCNPDQLLCHFILGADSRNIHNIHAFRPAIFYKQVYQYVDNKHFHDIIISGKNSSYPFDFSNSDTYNIQWFLGDGCEINHISDDATIYISAGANAAVRNAINVTLCSNGCRNINLENFHNESGSIIVCNSSVILKNAYFYAHQDGDIKIVGQYNTGSELFLENVFFGNLLGLSNFNQYYPIVNNSPFENSRIRIKNVYGLINNGGGGHNSGNAILLKYKNSYNGKVHTINPNGEFINTEHVTDSHKYFDSNSVFPLDWVDGTGKEKAYIKVIYIADEDRKLKLLGGTLTDEEVCVNSVDSTQSYRATMYDSGCTIQQLTNLLIRIFVGRSSHNYDRFYDFGVVMQNKETFLLMENGVDGLVHKQTGNIDTDYTACSVYKSDNCNVYVELLDNQLPTQGNWKCGDTIILNNGEKYVYNGKQWV